MNTKQAIQDKISSTKIKATGFDGGTTAGIGSGKLDRADVINGFRHSPAQNTSGWYMYSGTGEPSQADDFFQPVHVNHILEAVPEIGDLLSLEPGTRFLLDMSTGHIDIWFDDTVARIST